MKPENVQQASHQLKQLGALVQEHLLLVGVHLKHPAHRFPSSQHWSQGSWQLRRKPKQRLGLNLRQFEDPAAHQNVLSVSP